MDLWLLTIIASWRFESLTHSMIVVSVLGEWYVLLPIAAVIVFTLSRRGFVDEATKLAYSVVGTSIVVVMLKALIARTRPPEVLRVVAEEGYSFPSWHAAIAVAFWGYLAYLVVRRTQSKSIRVIVVLIGAVIVLTIGFSRVYLGVHYPSDVIGGFIIGLIALCLSVRFTGALPKKHR